MVRSRYSVVFAGAVLAGALAISCGSEPKRPPSSALAQPASGPIEPRTLPPQSDLRSDTATETSGPVHIDPRIIEACRDIPTPHFEFDSADIQPDSSRALTALADCDKIPSLCRRVIPSTS